MEVVEDQHQRRVARRARQRGHHGLEEPVALGLRKAGGGLARGRHLAAQLGHEPAELLELEAEALAELVHVPVQDQVRDQLHERLIGGKRLLVAASVEHDRPRLVSLARERGGQARLADAGLARSQHEAPLSAPRRGQRGAQLRHRALAPDEEPPIRLREDGRERQLPRSRLAGLGEHLLVEGTQLGRRCGAQLLAQQHAQVLERLECLGLVAASGVCPHQQGVAGLAERRQIHELAGGELRSQRSVAAERQRGLGQQLEGL